MNPFTKLKKPSSTAHNLQQYPISIPQNYTYHTPSQTKIQAPLPSKSNLSVILLIKAANKYIANHIVMFQKKGSRKPHKQVHSSFSRYLKKQGRVSFELKELTELLKDPFNLEQLTIILKSNYPVPQTFKILILLNRILLDRQINPTSLSDIIFSLQWSSKDELSDMLAKKLILPYKLYLQKRASSSISEYYGRSNSECEVRVYQLINLLNMGSTFADIIYTFGRYYLNQFGWAVDFNITIGADLKVVYQNMVDNVVRPAGRGILEEIEIIHEKLYVIYYNCYFHKYLKQYIPKWVITDFPLTPRKDTNKSTRSNSSSKARTYNSLSKAKSVNSTKSRRPIMSNGNMADSCLFLNSRVDQVVENVELEEDILEDKPSLRQEERFELLRSMERVVSMFKE